MAKNEKKTKPKVAQKTTKRPKLHCDQVVDMRWRLNTEQSGKLALALAAFREKVAEWKKSGSTEPLDQKHYPDIGNYQLTRKQQEALAAREYEGEDVALPTYHPILLDAVTEMGATSIRFSQKQTSPPRNWDEAIHGSWYELNEEDERVAPSGWAFFDKAPRRVHSKKVEAHITDPEKNILTFGHTRYVVGDGTSIRMAPILVSGPLRGNFKAGDTVTKRIALAGNKDAIDMVFRIEDKPNNGGAFILKGKWDFGIKEVPVMPGQALTVGFLFDSNGKRLTAKAIRGLDGDTKGLKFKTVTQVLGGPLHGKWVGQEKVCDELEVVDKENLKKMKERGGRSEDYEANLPRDKSITNRGTTCRVSPHITFCHGFRSAMVDMVPAKRRAADGGWEYTVILGDRSNSEYSAPDEKEVTEEKKSPKKKATRKAAAKPAKPVDEAPPVEVDTATEVEVVEEVEENIEV